jgi:hydroxylamine reductase (hybrid-cluster protein)
MSFLDKLTGRNKIRKEKFEEYQDSDRAMQTVENRKMSHDERELIKTLEQEKQYWIKEANRFEAKKRQLEDKKRGRDLMTFKPMSQEKDDLLKWGSYND